MDKSATWFYRYERTHTINHTQSSITCFITITLTKHSISPKLASHKHYQSYLTCRVNITKQLQQVKPEETTQKNTSIKYNSQHYLESHNIN